MNFVKLRRSLNESFNGIVHGLWRFSASLPSQPSFERRGSAGEHNPSGLAARKSGSCPIQVDSIGHSVLANSYPRIVNSGPPPGERTRERLTASHLFERALGPLTKAFPTSKKRSALPTSRVMPMRTLAPIGAVFRTSVPSQSGPSAQRSTPSSRRSICKATASRPGPLARSSSLLVSRRRSQTDSLKRLHGAQEHSRTNARLPR